MRGEGIRFPRAAATSQSPEAANQSLLVTGWGLVTCQHDIFSTGGQVTGGLITPQHVIFATGGEVTGGFITPQPVICHLSSRKHPLGGETQAPKP